MASSYIFVTVFVFAFWTTAVLGQSSECEELQPDGSIIYHACFSEPLSLISSARGFYNLSVEPQNSTCGDPSLLYCTLTLPKECKYCDVNSTDDQHPPGYMVDASGAATWWQSITWPKPSFPKAPEITITLSFGKTYELTDDLGILFKSGRPQNMILEKSTNNGATWSALQYYARDCSQYYSIGAGLDTDVTITNPDRVICSEDYSGQLPRSGGTVTFSVTESRYKLFLGPAYADYQSLFSAFENTQLDEFMTFTDLRIRLLYPATDGKEVFGSYIDFLHYYYAISNIGVTVRCTCYLHAKYCSYKGSIPHCECQHNTEGQNCERCKPLYNNAPWQPGSYLPYPSGTGNECKKCDCNDHADSCTYNSTLGHGVCNDCYHNTRGLHCELCTNEYYPNNSLAISNPKYCADCDCEMLGVVNNDTRCLQSATTSKPIGQCSCRDNVIGRRCDDCEDEYYGLFMMDNQPGVCKGCGCDTDGTKNQTNVCDKTTGACLCKATTTGRMCGECKDTFYGFPKNTPDEECSSCDCDPGGSLSDVCDKVTGQCPCRNDVTGLRCNETAANRFVPNLDSAAYQVKSGTCKLTDELATPSNPFTGSRYAACSPGQDVEFDQFEEYMASSSYTVAIRYNLNSSSTWTGAKLKHLYHADSSTGGCPKIGQTEEKTLSFPAGLGQSVSTQLNIDVRCKTKVTLSLGAGHPNATQIIIDSLVLLPTLNGFKVYDNASPAKKTEFDACLTNIASLSTRDAALSSMTCQYLTFSFMTQLYNGTKACNCNPTGSNMSIPCEPIGGQCSCKPGVFGRKCDMCKPRYFNFSNSGCSACSGYTRVCSLVAIRTREFNQGLIILTVITSLVVLSILMIIMYRERLKRNHQYRQGRTEEVT